MKAPVIKVKDIVQQVREIHFFPDGTFAGIVNSEGIFYSFCEITEG